MRELEEFIQEKKAQRVNLVLISALVKKFPKPHTTYLIPTTRLV
jgi:hypothetical protein